MSKDKNRNNMGELEILKEIISENKGLQQRVLEKIRMIRAFNKADIFQDAITKEAEKKESNSKKKKKMEEDQ